MSEDPIDVEVSAVEHRHFKICKYCADRGYILEFKHCEHGAPKPGPCVDCSLIRKKNLDLDREKKDRLDKPKRDLQVADAIASVVFPPKPRVTTDLIANPAPAPTAPPLAVPVDMLSAAAQQQMLFTARQMLGVVGHDDNDGDRTMAQPFRRFFQPLPEGKIPEWGADRGGMSVENIAIFLTMPEVLYTDYEKNKNNPPRTVFATPAEAFDHPCWKGMSGVNPIWRATERGVPHIGREIVVKEESRIISTDELSERQRRGKLPMPPHLKDDLAAAKRDLKLLKAKHDPGSGALTGKELAAAKRAKYREIERLEEQIAAYEGRGQWGKINIPGTGRSSFCIEIMPCPEGSSNVFDMRIVERYIRGAWGDQENDDRTHRSWEFDRIDVGWWGWWRSTYTDFENRVINRALEAKVFSRWWLNSPARAQWLLGDREPSEDRGCYTGFALPPKQSLDTPAKDSAECGYRRREDGSLPDETIRRVGPGAGHDPAYKRFGQGYNPKLDNFGS